MKSWREMKFCVRYLKPKIPKRDTKEGLRTPSSNLFEMSLNAETKSPTTSKFSRNTIDRFLEDL